MPVDITTGSEDKKYPLTVKHVSNGEPGNAATFRAPTEALDRRTEVLRTFVNTQETAVNTQLAAHSTFNSTHRHGGGADGVKLNFQQVYSNDDDTASLAISENGSFTTTLSNNSSVIIKKTGTDFFKVGYGGSVNFSLMQLESSKALTIKNNDATVEILKADEATKSVTIPTLVTTSEVDNTLAATKSFKIKRSGASNSLLEVGGTSDSVEINLAAGGSFVVKASDGTELLKVDNDTKKVIIPSAFQVFT